jgi:hypothetical protein
MQQQSQADATGRANLDRQDARELRRELELEDRNRRPVAPPPIPFNTKCPKFYLTKLTSFALSLAKLSSSIDNLNLEKAVITQHHIDGTLPPSLSRNQTLLDAISDPNLRIQLAQTLCSDRINIVSGKLDMYAEEIKIVESDIPLTYNALVYSIRSSFTLAECIHFVAMEKDTTLSVFNIKKIDNDKIKEKKRIAFEKKKLLEQEVHVVTRKEHEDLRKLLSKPPLHSKTLPKPKQTGAAVKKSTNKSKNLRQTSRSKNGQARPPQKKKGTTEPKPQGQQRGKTGKQRS